jgi:GNAT superfamily N-acetyltransferase
MPVNRSPRATTLRTFQPVTTTDIRAFSRGDVAAAGRLLAERHQRHRLVEPLLSPRFEDAAVAAEAVATAYETDGSRGAVAERDGEFVGYLLGAPKTSPVWGPNVWVESAGYAACDPELTRDLYAVAATDWVARGLTAQYVVVPTSDPPQLEAWYRLGFGQQQAHAMREVLEPERRTPARVTIRSAERSDIEVLAKLDISLPDHQALAPTFSAGVTSSHEEAVAEWEEDFDDSDYHVVVAEHDGKVVGSAVGCALEKSSSHIGPARPDNAGFLGFAAVLPEARGLGAGRALGEAVLAWSSETGFDSVVTDWRVTNLLSSRAWPALGFRPTFSRLHRLIGY